jgi:hypothetical protein
MVIVSFKLLGHTTESDMHGPNSNILKGHCSSYFSLAILCVTDWNMGTGIVQRTQSLIPSRGWRFYIFYRAQTSSGANLATCTVHTRGFVSKNKVADLWIWQSSPYSTKVKNDGSISPLHHMSSRRCTELITNRDYFTLTLQNGTWTNT